MGARAGASWRVDGARARVHERVASRFLAGGRRPWRLRDSAGWQRPTGCPGQFANQPTSQPTSPPGQGSGARWFEPEVRKTSVRPPSTGSQAKLNLMWDRKKLKRGNSPNDANLSLSRLECEVHVRKYLYHH